MPSGKRFVALLSLLAVLFVAMSPFGFGAATLPTPICFVSPGERGEPLIGPTVPQATPAGLRLLPSRAPPLA